MALSFVPEQYVPLYQTASDVEHVEGAWTHPKDYNTVDGYVKDTLIFAIGWSEVVHRDGGGTHTAFSVYFGPGNEWNAQVRVETTGENIDPNSTPAVFWDNDQTRRLAEVLGAGVHRHQHGSDGTTTPVRKIVLKTDSALLEEVVTPEGVQALMATDFVSQPNNLPMNRYVIHFYLRLLTALLNSGFGVFFWSVSPEENAEARRMVDEANAAAP